MWTTTKITDAVLRGLGPGDGVRDRTLWGFIARRCKNEAIEYSIRRQGKRPIYKSIGHGPPFTLTQARAEAERLLYHHYLGAPPPVLAPAKSLWTLDSAFEKYKEHLVTQERSEKTKTAYEFALARLDPKLRKRALNTLTPDDIATEKVRLITANGPSAAHASVVLVRVLARYVTKAFHEPIRDLTIAVKMKLKKKGAIAMRVEDLPAWWARVQQHEPPLRQQAQLFLLLSGLRRESLVEMRWEHFNRARTSPLTFHIPAPKGGEDKAFDLVLSSELNAVLDRALALAVDDSDGVPATMRDIKGWVWPAPHRGGAHMSSSSFPTGAAAKATVGTTPHDLRATYSSLGRLAGVAPDIISILDNHTSRGGNPVTEGYIQVHGLGPMLLEAQEKISAFLVKAIGIPAAPKATAPSASDAAEYAKDAG
jgi:integrase